MSKIFPKLTQTHVRIELDDKGNFFNCPMLPISAMSEMNECSEIMAKCKNLVELENVRQRMIALVKTVMPEQYCANLERFDFAKLSELLAYLMYGDNDDLPKEEQPAEKN